VGVNPSLTITALAEHAMSHVPATGDIDGRAEPDGQALEGLRPEAVS
jgi:hypothetical protein